jgi:septal ring factor EnvC (AmiA/AmiB activator)
MKNLEDKALNISGWIGSIPSLIIHTLFFVSCFVAIIFGADFEKVLLTLTTVVSLEAIYLSIFIQMSVNRNQKALEAAQQNIEEMSEGVAEIEKDIDEIQEDVEEIQKDVDIIQENVEEINEDVDKIEKDIDEIQEDVEEIVEDK